MISIGNGTLGLITLVVPLLIIGAIALRRLPWVLAFFIALLAAGAGYLHTTGALKEIGAKVRDVMPAGIIAEHKAPAPVAPEPSSTMAPATPAPSGTMAPATPPAEPAPAATPAPAPAPTPSPAPANP